MVVLDRQLKHLAVENRFYSHFREYRYLNSYWLGRNSLLILSVLIGLGFVIGQLIERA